MPAGVLRWTRGGRERLVGDSAGRDGGGARRRRGSGEGMATRSGDLASRAQGGANWGVVVVGGGLWQRVGGEQAHRSWMDGR